MIINSGVTNITRVPAFELGDRYDTYDIVYYSVTMSLMLVIRALKPSRGIITIAAPALPLRRQAIDLPLLAQNGRQGSFFNLLMEPLLTIKVCSMPRNMVMDIIPF